MRKAYYTLDLAEAVLLKDHLLHNGVASLVKNKGVVRIPHEGVASEIWVNEDSDDNDVRALIRGFLQQRANTTGASRPSWPCRHCREENPGTFEVCWNCSQERQITDESVR